MSFSVEGVIGPGETETFSATVRPDRSEVPSRIATYGRRGEEWSAEAADDLFITSIKISGKEQFEIRGEADWLPFMVFWEGTDLRVKFDPIPPGSVVEVTVASKAQAPQMFAVDFYDRSNDVIVPHGMSVQYTAILGEHFQSCPRRLCTNAFVGEGICPEGAKIMHAVEAMTFLYRVEVAREGVRHAHAR